MFRYSRTGSEDQEGSLLVFSFSFLFYIVCLDDTFWNWAIIESKASGMKGDKTIKSFQFLYLFDIGEWGEM